MFVLIRTRYGSWQYVKDSPEGFRFGIYNINALTGEENLKRCKEAYPMFEFKLGD